MKATTCSAASALLAVALLVGCSPAPAPCIAPAIPVPPPVELPAVIVPVQTEDGRYCFDPETLRRLKEGIRDLKADDAALRELIRRYEAWRTGR